MIMDQFYFIGHDFWFYVLTFDTLGFSTRGQSCFLFLVILFEPTGTTASIVYTLNIECFLSSRSIPFWLLRGNLCGRDKIILFDKFG